MNGPFQVPTFSTSGGGSSTFQYDSAKVQSALATPGLRVVGVVEK